MEFSRRVGKFSSACTGFGNLELITCKFKVIPGKGDDESDVSVIFLQTGDA